MNLFSFGKNEPRHVSREKSVCSKTRLSLYTSGVQFIGRAYHVQGVLSLFFCVIVFHWRVQFIGRVYHIQGYSLFFVCNRISLMVGLRRVVYEHVGWTQQRVGALPACLPVWLCYGTVELCLFLHDLAWLCRWVGVVGGGGVGSGIRIIVSVVLLVVVFMLLMLSLVLLVCCRRRLRCRCLQYLFIQSLLSVLSHVRFDGNTQVIGWRDVPFDNSMIGDTAKGTEPHIVQCFVENTTGRTNWDFERELYRVRKVTTLRRHLSAVLRLLL